MSAKRPRSVPANSDPLGQTLHLLRMEGLLYARTEATAPWGIDLPPLADTLMFHIVTRGSCELAVGSETRTLERGSLALVPHGRGHVLRSAADAGLTPLFEVPVEKVSERYEVMRLDGGGEPAELLCGVARFDHVAAEQLIAQLPPLLVVETWNLDEGRWLDSLLACMTHEAKRLLPGGETIVTRLADVLVIHVIRAWLDAEQEHQQQGWLAGLRDPWIGAAMAAVQREPGRPWTLATLAESVHMSRSAFAARFTEVVGEPAMRYLTRWRMHVARHRLKDGDVTLAVLAEELGYASEAAFCRAFKREFGISPGRARTRSAGVA